ncbi:energy transducer TonB [Aurantibacter sp.]|uniref:energy transducer TonB n=1 Tax=Aurantibacter sp. TaxID=2807103 RepID=UPI0035C80D9C
MEPKKNPNANIGRNSSLYLAVGLALMLALSYFSINYKTFDKEAVDIGLLDLGDLDDEEIPITEILNTPPPPPPPPAAPEVIEVVEDEEEVEETVIESTETTQDEVIAEVEDVEVEEVEEDISVPFAIIENVPVFPGCEREKNNDARRKCMSDKIQKFVSKKFNTDIAADNSLEGVMKISIGFVVDKTGNVINVRARAPHPALEKEAQRVVALLPKMQPGKQRGKAVKVPFGFPIRFQVE